MAAHNTQKVTLTIANGATDSEYLSSKFSAGVLKALLGSVISMTVYTPSALTGAVTMQVRSTESSGTPATLQAVAGTDTPFAAAKAVVVNAAGIKDFRMHSAAAEGAERIFEVVFQVATL